MSEEFWKKPLLTQVILGNNVEILQLIEPFIAFEFEGELPTLENVKEASNRQGIFEEPIPEDEKFRLEHLPLIQPIEHQKLYEEMYKYIYFHPKSTRDLKVKIYQHFQNRPDFLPEPPKRALKEEETEPPAAKKART